MRKALQRFQPAGAWADLRYFLKHRQPHQIVFFTLAVALTVLALLAFVHDSHFVPEYHRDIVYVKQWRLDRTNAEIIAQQKIDGIEQTRRVGEEKRRQEANHQALKKIDDGLRRWGI